MTSIAAATSVLGGLALLSAPAHAASVPVTFSTAAGCTSCRTLVLDNTDGSTLNGLNLSSGSGGFVAQVVDNGVAPASLGNFDVESTMSNLYGYDSVHNTWSCTNMIPSSDVSLSSLPSLLSANSLGAVVQPVFNLSGSLNSLLSVGMLAQLPLGFSLPSTTTIPSVQGQVSTTVNQAAEAGSSVTNLVGSVLGNNTLPVNLNVTGSGAFTVPDLPPSNSPCTNATNPNPVTQRQVMRGLLNGILPTVTAPLLNKATSVIGSPTLTTLVTDGYIDSATAESLVSTATGISEADLNETGGGVLNPFTGLLTSIENSLTASVASLVSSATALSGTYSAGPSMTISDPTASPATYDGVLTVTLTSNT
jgi:hypothetical protein